MSIKFVPKRQIDNKSALVQVMAWRLTGGKPLPEPMLTQFTDAYMQQHYGEDELRLFLVLGRCLFKQDVRFISLRYLNRRHVAQRI